MSTNDDPAAKADEKFTPGPWSVSSYEGGWTCVREPGGAIIAKLSLSHEPNACLIAAAPELYESLQEMCEVLDSIYPCVDWGKTFRLPIQKMNEAPLRARATLAKAVSHV